MFLAVSMNVSPLLTLEPPDGEIVRVGAEAFGREGEARTRACGGFKEQVDDDLALEVAALLAPPLADLDELLGGIEDGLDLGPAQVFQTEQVVASPLRGFAFRRGQLHCHDLQSFQGAGCSGRVAGGGSREEFPRHPPPTTHLAQEMVRGTR